MTSREPRRRVELAALLALLLAAPAAAQDKAAGLFDDDKPAAKADPAKAKDQPKAQPADPAKPKAGSAADRDVIGFTQQNAASQMTELEERMYRLSEALRGLEPENASRLRLALKFSKEELILEQMRETNKLLKDAQINKAETEVRELLAKLEHLRDVLLAEDLDFQLKLARLRQLRETMNQLDRVVKEERRAVGWSRFTLDQRQAKARLVAVRPDLEALARDGAAIGTEAKGIKPDAPLADRKAALTGLVARERAVARAAAALAMNPLFADFQPSELRKAEPQVNAAADRLEADDLAAAAEAQGRADAVFAAELAGLDARVAEVDRDVAEREFRRHEADQARNRQAATALGAGSARLGDVGVALQKDMIRAGAAMETAGQHLAKAEAEPAAGDQAAALEILARSADDLARAAEKLLVELRTELQAKLVAGLTELHEAESSIRETTAAQAPRLVQKSRSAAIVVAGLGQKQGELAGKTEAFLALVEETEYGIALPTTLRVLGREMRLIDGWLKEVDASPRTVAFQQRVEDDFLATLQAVRRLPPTTPPPPGSPLPSDLRERERELNRLIAELKLIRLLQTRLNDDTVGVDKTRPNPSDLPGPLRREVETLESSQEEIRDSLAKIAERIEQP